MPDELDDLEAVRVIVETLRPFPADDQERIVRCSVVQCSVFGKDQTVAYIGDDRIALM